MKKLRVVDVKKGDMVHDLISGFSGTVTAKVDHLHGTVEWLIESERTPMGSSEGRFYSEKEILRLRVIGNQLDGGELKQPALKLGDIVKDRVSGFSGTVSRCFTGMCGTKEWMVEGEAMPQQPQQNRTYSDLETARLVVVASAFDDEKAVPARPAVKNGHKRRG